ncbi:MAG: OsmC family protein [Thermoguttaceae bacterium]
MTVTLDRMIHTVAVHQELGKEIGLEGCCAFGGKGEDLNPIDLVAMGVASCMIIVMAKGAEAKGLDLTGTWAETSYELKDYKIASMAVTIHCPCSFPSEQREFLEKEGHRCPVYLVVKEGVGVNVAFQWGSKAAPTAAKGGKSCAQCG